MKKMYGIIPIVSAVVLAAAGYFLQRLGAVLPTVLFSAAAVIVMALLSYKSKSQPGEEPVPLRWSVYIFGVAGAGLLLWGGLHSFREASVLLNKITAALAIVTALCYVGTLGAFYGKKKPSPALVLLPIIYYIVQMILDFRNWSTDPILADYCFKLFARLCVMLGVYHLGGSAFGICKQKRTLFFCLAGIILCGVSLQGAGTEYLLITGGSALWLLAGSLSGFWEVDSHTGVRTDSE